MAQGFYTLEEAANLLGLPADELNRMAQQRKLRAFADRGTWRFRTQDIDEMARQQGTGSDPEIAADEPAPAPARTSGVAASAAPAAFDDDLIPFDAGLDLEAAPKPGSGIHPSTADDDLLPLDDLLDNPPAVGGGSAINLGADQPLGPSASKGHSSSKASTLKPDSDVRLVMNGSNSEFELTTDSNPGSLDALAELPTAPAGRATGGPMIPESDPGLDLGLAPAPDSDAGFGLDLAPEPVHVLDSDPDAGLGLDLAPAPDSLFDSDPDAGLGLAPEPTPAGDLAPVAEGNDADVSVDFDSSTLDDSMVSMGGPAPDSDVRLEPAGISQAPLDPGAPVESMQTEEIDLDAELQQADLASQARRGKTKPVSDSKVRGRTPMPPKGTMLPTSSPFELSQDDLEYSSGLGDSNVNRPLGSEFELTLAPEDESSPLNLGDDEDVDLGGLPSKDGMSSSARAELSGINLHDPADSGISLEKGDTSDSVDFELTVDEDSGPKTIKGKIPDSDSEFELSLEESGSSDDMLPAADSSSDSGDQKDIFETDFSMPALEGEESRSEAVALDGADTDLESSDFDLAVSDTDLSVGGTDDSASEVVVLPESGDDLAAAAPKKKSRVTGGSLDSVDELLLDDEGLEVEDEEDDELSPAATVPAAQAEWGMFPIFLLVPCVLVMFVAGLMSYELLHGMWGYHASSKPSGLVVRGIAGMFTDDLPKE